MSLDFSLTIVWVCSGVARTLKKVRTSKGDYWISRGSLPLRPFFKMGTSLKGKNLLPEQLLMV